jgi:hypothetical protein
VAKGWNSDYGEKRSTFTFPDMLQKVGKGRKVEQGTPLVFVDHELTQVHQCRLQLASWRSNRPEAIERAGSASLRTECVHIGLVDSLVPNVTGMLDLGS